MINRKNRKLVTLVAVGLSFCLFALEQSTSAQGLSTSAPSAGRNCRNVKGKINEVSNPTGTTGRITRGGILNGTTQLVLTSGFPPTPDPTTVSYTDDFTVTTNRGVLKTHNVAIHDFATGVFTEIGRIDPNASSGIFAGATGVLFTSGKTTDGNATFQSNIIGEICLAHDDGDEDDDEDGGDRRLVP